VRDLAKFTIDAIESNLTGAYTVAAPSGGITYGEMMHTIATVTGDSAAKVEWISVEHAQERAGDFPFWAGGESVGMLQMNTDKAVAAGLTSRPLEDTIRDI
jgi:2'-hydroxyisoflavone reductase